MGKVTIEDIARIFRMHSWRFQIVDESRLQTSFDGVRMVITTDDAGEAVLCFTGLVAPSAAARARANDLDSLLAELSRHLGSDSAFVYDGNEGSVLYVVGFAATNGVIGDQQLQSAIMHSVIAVQTLGRIFEDLVRGKVTLQQTLVAVQAAADNVKRDRRNVA